MPVYTKSIPGVKTSPVRSVNWTPCKCGGKLEIRDAKKTTVYQVTKLETEWAGTAVRLTKPDGESYNTFAGTNSRDDQCDCAWGCYGKEKPCRHLEAVRVIRANKWLEQLMKEVPADPQVTEAEIDRMAEFFGAE